MHSRLKNAREERSARDIVWHKIVKIKNRGGKGRERERERGGSEAEERSLWWNEANPGQVEGTMEE